MDEEQSSRLERAQPPAHPEKLQRKAEGPSEPRGPSTAATKVTAHHLRSTKDPRERLPIPALRDLNPASWMKSICHSHRETIRQRE
jgi:hypothetical protein